ncbi:MAG: DUF4402 domain-containing protein [Acidiferrobacteraceae bacterium]
MNLKKKILVGLLAAVGPLAWANSALAANATGTVTARLYSAITISKTTDLDFGVMSDGGAGGSMTVNGDNTTTAGGATTSTGGTPAAAEFAVGGANNAAYLVDTTASSANLTSGANTMAITYTAYSFNDDNTYATAYAAGTPPSLSGTGADTLRVGGTVTVGAGQATGTYTGTVSVTVTYQ